MVTIFTFQLGMNITWANQQKDSGGQMKRDPIYNYGQYTGNIQDDFIEIMNLWIVLGVKMRTKCIVSFAAV